MVDARSLWQDYLFLTKEMLKFVDRSGDWEIFADLMEQRERLQISLEETPDQESFKNSTEGLRLKDEIESCNEKIEEMLHLRLSQMKRHHQVGEAYNHAVTGNSLGNRSWER